MPGSKNPADVAALIIRAEAAKAGVELADDFDERIAEMRARYNELIPADDPLQGFSNESSLRRYNEMVDDFYAKRWTPEFPKEPGFYWMRNALSRLQQERGEEPDGEATIVRIDADGDIYLTGDEVPLRLYGGGLVSAEFSGPIKPE